jgi:predicted AAA+ superfamily ATPase
VNVSSVARDIGMNNETVARRLHDLIGAYLLLPVHQNDDMRPRLQAQSKQYFIDPLMARLAHLRNARHRPPDLTRLTEQQLAVAIARRLEHRSPGTYAGYDRLFYARTPTKKEIDFVGPDLEPVAIEGKYTGTGRWLGEAITVNASKWRGVLATRTVLDTSPTPGIAWAVPASFLAYSMDT